MTILSDMQRERKPGFVEGLAQRLVDLDLTYRAMKSEAENLLNGTTSGTLTREEHARMVKNWERQKRMYDSYGTGLKMLRYLLL